MEARVPFLKNAVNYTLVLGRPGVPEEGRVVGCDQGCRTMDEEIDDTLNAMAQGTWAGGLIFIFKCDDIFFPDSGSIISLVIIVLQHNK